MKQIENEQDWLSISKEHEAVLVDFWADWCAPCKAIAPHLETLAKEFGSQLCVVKVNITLPFGQTLADKYHVRGIPTLILIQDGVVTSTKVGALPYDQLHQWLKTSLASS